MNGLQYAVIIATYERPEPLRRALQSLVGQSWPVEQVIVMDASRDKRSQEVAAEFSSSLPIQYVKSSSLSSALQRNEGLDLCRTPYVLFLDDDAVLEPDTVEQLGRVFLERGDRVGAVAARTPEAQVGRLSRGLWWYYRLQAGYSHPNYGGKLFGPAINRMPCYEEQTETLIPADWLPSCVVLYRASLAQREKFPAFPDYSYMEDAHLSARVARTHELYFHSGACCRHENAGSVFKRRSREVVRQRLRNQRAVAREAMGQSWLVFEVKFLLHRLVTSLSLVRQGGPGWTEELIGLWT